MITLADFQNYLSRKIPLQPLADSYLTGQEQQLFKWVANLPAQTEAQQAVQLEQIITELLTVTELEDEQRLKLLGIVVGAADRLITSLHRHYNYELGAFNKEQLRYVDQVKSLYYLIILAYDGIVQRESLALNDQQLAQTENSWKRFLTLAKTPPLLLAAAIYQSLLTYQKLFYEINISYQKPTSDLWLACNHLYYTACQINAAHIDLSAQVVTKQALSIHELYVQICLYSLLNVRAMRRANILLVQRLLPLWATQVSATIEPETETRIFVNLQGDRPPEYLTASSVINPYEENRRCLFIDLKPLTLYLYQRQQNLFDEDNETIEYQLINKVLMAINHRYIERQVAIPTKHSPKQRATIISGFNNIHYEVASAHGLMSIIAAKELPIEQLPRYDTQPKKDTISSPLIVETFDSSDTVSNFRILHLLPLQDLPAQPATTAKPAPIIPLNKPSMVDDSNDTSSDEIADIKNQFNNESAAALSADTEADTDIEINTAPPALQLMSLFLLCRSDSSSKLKWSLGMVRWLNFDSKYIEVEWQVFGHLLTACALRLDNRDQRRPDFVPAFMVAGDEELQTEFTIIVSPYHFQPNDKVMLRLHDKQKTLRLQQCLIDSKEFSQYKVVQL